jgi:osmoprotectant transport system substrate-binding protein
VRRRLAGLAGVLLLAVLVACGGAGEQATVGPPTTLRFASYDFLENQILAEIYAEAARRVDVPVSIQHAVGTREVVQPALQQGVVDVVVDYLGTALSFAQPDAPERPREPEAMHAALSSALGDRGVMVLGLSEAEDQNGFAVTTAFARENGVGRLSELTDLAPQLAFGGPPECPDRPYCLQGLQDTYDLHFGEVLSMTSRAATVEALMSGLIDVGLLETTDARLAVAPIQLLIDDRGLQPHENIVPLIRTEALDRWGDKVRTALNEVSARLTTNDMRQLNRAVEIDGRTPAEAAASWWG